MPTATPQKFGLALANCTDPARVNELNHWYSTIHIPDTVSTAGFVRGTRYQLATQPDAGQRQFLALYEIQTDDSYPTINEHQQAGFRRLAEVAPGRSSPDMFQMVDAGFFEQVSAAPIWSPPGTGDDQPPRALFIELRLCTAESRLDEVEQWYEHTHLPAIARLPGVGRTATYRWPRARGGNAQFLSLYEVAETQRLAATDGFDALQVGEHPASAPDCLEYVTSGAYSYVSDILKTWSDWDDLRAWKGAAS